MQGCKAVICVVRFDLEQGQVVRFCVPDDFLSVSERRDVGYHAFPDSKSFELRFQRSIHDTIFHFRIKRDKSADASNNGKASPKKASGSRSKEWLKWLYGYSFCRQRQDKHLPRGGDQTSVVVLLEKPYMDLIQQISKIAGQLYFDYGEDALVQVMESILSWTTLKPNVKLSIQAAGQTLPVHVPERKPESLDSYEVMSHSLSNEDGAPCDHNFWDCCVRMTFSKVCIFSAFHGVVRHLWYIWEAMLLAKPVLIFGSNPDIVSMAVSAAMDLVAPLSYCADFRPYFTIQDSEFQTMQNPSKCGTKEGLPSVVGVTNTYFLKAYKSWPNILAVGGGSDLVRTNSSPASGAAASAKGSGGWAKYFLSSLRGGASSKLVDMIGSDTQDLWAKRKSHIKANHSVLRSLEHVAAGCNENQWNHVAQNNSKIIQKHFRGLTESFLSAFDPYFRPKQEERKGLWVGYAAHLLPPAEFPTFDKATFLGDLRESSTVLRRNLLQVLDHDDLIELYEEFLESINFQPWFSNKLSVSKYRAHRAWGEQRVEFDMGPILEKLSENEKVDTFGIVEEQLMKEVNTIGGSMKLVKKLRDDLEKIFTSLPTELQQSIMLNPGQAQLLKECYVPTADDDIRYSAPEESFTDMGRSP
eukprot:CAMPEP_0198247520 /NCGR_PEP_ID=MMETSP1446-20131203/46517_1 /TAXON_ID=1461542 ORGANISM="Unidentified sp, Strain CCMP2111" /NCGR_SAMPLE_ID=MMETSP1446 /ASSEMBLY_ACC=CAM_ASM_001112 /LENGTH=639 /DNA_ID=CAMNT_0043931845 /DNA_START=368 /DNA_END=2284 /DNA_ORIENTATION=-